MTAFTKNKYALLLIFLGFSILGKSQNSYQFKQINQFYATLEAKLQPGENLNFTPVSDFQFTSLQIELASPVAQIKVYYNDANGLLKYIETKVTSNHDRPDVSVFSSPLQIFNTPQKNIRLEFENFAGPVKIHLFYAAPLPLVEANLKLNKSGSKCNKPTMISYTVWRTGLPDPKPPRLTTEVEHLVVHHSAGSNTDTNYLNTVRNIYLLHTQSNGWDDIGYNFLVAPNGVVFNGRDPQGVGDDDDILGAHFCGKNNNTMGVCMMGNFMLVKPTTAAIASLKYLLAWKLKKDRINALGQTQHPQGTGSLLNNICGHRDGCNTDCPGDSLYKLLPSITKEAARIADSCGLNLGNRFFYSLIKPGIFPNPGQDRFTVSSTTEGIINIYDTNGRGVFSTVFKPTQSFQLFLPSGLYFYRIIENNSNISNGKLIIKTK